MKVRVREREGESKREGGKERERKTDKESEREDLFKDTFTWLEDDTGKDKDKR